MDRVRTALIGCGKVGHLHAAALRELPESEFVAVCDSDPARAAAFAQQYGTGAFSEVGAMLAEAQPGAVMICTPHPLHARPAIECAKAGVHVLVEKPLAATLTDCDAMFAAARTAGTRLGAISQRRFYEP